MLLKAHLFWLLAIGLGLSGAGLQAQPNPSEGTEKKPSKVANPLEKLREYAPYHKGLHHADPESENNDYKTIQKGLDHIENELMRLVLMRFEDVEEAIYKETIHQNAYKSLLFDMKARYYRGISRRAQNNPHMHRTLVMLDAAHERFLDIEGSLQFFGHSPNDIKNTLYRIKKLRGILGFFRGTPLDLRKAIDNFEYLIGRNPMKAFYAQNDDETRDIYHYLVNAYRLSYNQNKDNSFLSKYLLQRELYYLYRLTVLNTPNNEPLRDYKLRQLLSRYKGIVNYKGSEYNSLYKPYLPFEDATEGSSVPKQTEQQSERRSSSQEAPSLPSSKDDKPPENNTESDANTPRNTQPAPKTTE